MSRKQPFNVAIDAINHYRGKSTLVDVSYYTPPAFVDIREMFTEAKNKGTEVLVESSEINNMDSVSIVIDYIGDRWCRGYEEKRYFGEIIRIPHTISYADVYVNSHETDRTKAKTKIFFRGENPFG